MDGRNRVSLLLGLPSSESPFSMSKPLIFVVIDTPAERLGLSVTEKAVLVSLTSHLNAKRNGSEVWPSVARLAALTGASISVARRCMRKLETLGFVKTRTDTGSSNVYSIIVDAIQSATDPGQIDRGNGADPGQIDRPTPVRSTGDPGQIDRRTTKEQPIRTDESFSPIGCSANLKLKDGDHQRKMALAGVVSKAAKRMRVDHDEQPTIEKARKEASL